jgi:hypothetical protein
VDPIHPGNLCRDDILFHVVGSVADLLFLDDYEVREIQSAAWPLSYPLEQTVGEVVMMARSDEVGGPLPDAEASPILARANALGRQLELTGPLSLLLPMDRAVILPAPTLAGHFEFSADHPLAGVTYFSVIDALELLDKLVALDPDNAKIVLAFLELCREQRLALSWRRG